MIQMIKLCFYTIALFTIQVSIEALPFGGTWKQVGLDIDGKTNFVYSGYSIAMSSNGKTIAIGGPAGYVRVYAINSTSGNWSQVGTDINGEASNDRSGWSVCMSADGNTIAIGAPFNDNNIGVDSGHVRVYSLNTTSRNWTQVGLDIDGEAQNDQSGYSVAMSANGKIIAVGAPGNGGNGSSSGHVRVYGINSTNNTGSWTQVGLDIDGEATQDQSGASVAMSSDGKTIAIGARFNNGSNSASGHVRVYSVNSTSGNWTQVGLDINGEATNDQSGVSVAISSDGKTVAVGALLFSNRIKGRVSVYSFNITTNTWVQVGLNIDGESTNDQLGYPVVMSADGQTIAAGAIGYDRANESNIGYVRVYSINSTSGRWAQVGSDIIGEAANDQSGFSIAISADGKTIAIGAINNDGNGEDSGHVRVYKYELPTNSPTKTPTKMPTKRPTKSPTKNPTTKNPIKSPTKVPTKNPTKVPTKRPTNSPTKLPTKVPTKTPTKVPSQITLPVPIIVPIQVPLSVPVTAPTNCGLFGLNIFCPRRGECGFWRRLLNVRGC